MNDAKKTLLMLGLLLSLYSTAQNTDTLYGYNGTYNSPTNLFKNNNYMRVHFFNDSLFIFTIIEAYNPTENGKINEENKDLRLSGHSFFGIARLVKYKGVKSWIGVSDFSPTDDPNDPSYLSLAGRADFDIILKNIGNCDNFRHQDLDYNVYHFFLQKDQISIIGICGITRFFEVGNYHKVDNSKMLFGIAPNDNFFKIYRDNTAPAIAKKACQLSAVPLQEKVPENKSIGSLSKGDRIYLTGRNFMNYVFVVQFDSNYTIIKYGWIPRNFLQKAK
jgi:hypothetical protein